MINEMGTVVKINPQNPRRIKFVTWGMNGEKFRKDSGSVEAMLPGRSNFAGLESGLSQNRSNFFFVFAVNLFGQTTEPVFHLADFGNVERLGRHQFSHWNLVDKEALIQL